ncbi:MAG TPA: MFS transporter [Gaiellaceae bacterium]|nr:MFS transporter [Gaiellaceae bacterium]HEU5405791.1 MFS transporter [Gaiellaceae bacterium]
MGSYAASLRAVAKVFENPHVRSLQLAGAGSILGTYAYAIALPVYAYHSGGARTVGLVFFARFVFAALAAPWLGVLADRWSRRQLMLGGDLVRCAIFAGMTAAASAGSSPYIVYVLAVTSTVVSGSYSPAQAALLPSLVKTPDELTAANLVGNTVASVGMFVGPALGGILLAVSTPAAVFALNGALFLWSAFFVVQVPRDDPPERTERSSQLLPELTAGFRTVWRTPALRVVITLTTGDAILYGALEVLLVVLALRILDAGNAGYGWLNTGMGVGSVVGAFVVAAIAARRRLAGGFGLGIFLSGVAVCIAAALSTLAPALIVLGLVGMTTILVEVTSVTLLQRSAENVVLGRVFALYETLALAGTAAGAVVAPALVSWLGPRGALVATGAFLPVLLVPLWPSLRRIDAEALIAVEPLELLRRIEMFAQLPEPVLERLAATATAVSVAADQVIVSRGEAGNHFYVIATGRALVELDDGTRELGPGDFFGEIALLRDVPRTATVRASEPVRLYAVERDDFIAAVTGHAPTLAAAESVVVSRMPVGALG